MSDEDERLAVPPQVEGEVVQPTESVEAELFRGLKGIAEAVFEPLAEAEIEKAQQETRRLELRLKHKSHVVHVVGGLAVATLAAFVFMVVVGFPDQANSLVMVLLALVGGAGLTKLLGEQRE